MKKVIMTTGDLKKNYEILEIIYCEVQDNRWKYAFEEGLEDLEEKCLKVGDDAVICIRQNMVKDVVGLYGTAVKIN